ncbi:hypothetical protein [Alteromonas sp. H39]
MNGREGYTFRPFFFCDATMGQSSLLPAVISSQTKASSVVDMSELTY